MPDLEIPPVLNSYREDATRLVDIPPMETIISAAKRRRRRSTTTVTAAALAVLVAGGTAVLYSDRQNIQTPAASIDEVDWTSALVTLPSSGNQNCPTGPQRLRPGSDSELPGIGVARGKTGQNSLAVLPGIRAYGDVTGDGRDEVVLPVWCTTDLEPDFGDRGAQLLVVSMNTNDELVGLGYAGPVGAHYRSFTVSDGKLVAQVEYQSLTDSATVYSAYAPAHSRSYTWDGSNFEQTAGRTQPLVLSPDKQQTGSLTSLPDILTTSGTKACLGADVRFTPATATDGGVTYEVTDNVRSLDLDRDGNDELLVEIVCRTSKYAAASLYLLEQGTDRFTTIDVPFANDGRLTLDDWTVNGLDLTLTFHRSGQAAEHRDMHWNGTHFSPPVGVYRR